MYLFQQELARDRSCRSRLEAASARRAHALSVHRRWRRRAERAALRARLALTSL